MLKIITGLVLLAIASSVATTGAFANAAGGAYIQCKEALLRLSDARRTAGEPVSAHFPLEIQRTAQKGPSGWDLRGHHTERDDARRPISRHDQHDKSLRLICGVFV
jgi:hypothetical protein